MENIKTPLLCFGVHYRDSLPVLRRSKFITEMKLTFQKQDTNGS